MISFILLLIVIILIVICTILILIMIILGIQILLVLKTFVHLMISMGSRTIVLLIFLLITLASLDDGHYYH